MLGLENRKKFDLKIIMLLISLILAVGYSAYVTIQYFKAEYQVNEANNMVFDANVLFTWSMQHHKNDVQKSCNFEMIQHITTTEEFQNANRFLELEVPLRQRGQYVERLELMPSVDLTNCNITAYFKTGGRVISEVSGKYITRSINVQDETSHCITNIQKRRLVKACMRI